MEATSDELLMRNRFECKRLSRVCDRRTTEGSVQQKLGNELRRIINLLEPYQANLRMVIESNVNWFWLIDDLQSAGFEMLLD